MIAHRVLIYLFPGGKGCSDMTHTLMIMRWSISVIARTHKKYHFVNEPKKLKTICLWHEDWETSRIRKMAEY